MSNKKQTQKEDIIGDLELIGGYVEVLKNRIEKGEELDEENLLNSIMRFTKPLLYKIKDYKKEL